MKIVRLIGVFAILLNLSCSSDDNNNFPPGSNCIQGQGLLVSESRTLVNFHSINSSIFADILLTQGPIEDVVIEAQQNILDEINTQVVNGELRISLDRCVDIVQAVKIYITIPDVRSLTTTGVGDIVGQNQFDLTDLEITLTGVGDVELEGMTNILDITLTGVGDIETFELNSNICNVNLTGAGDVEVFVDNELDVIITGVGTVFYKGTPSITSNITGSGSIVDAN
ncbi:MAG: head GIN domain-containing protein [Flavobacteriaceae bacterium]|nr:head GIN domain-containing protein [Flavobacteriaceae bacterium]